MKKTFLSTSITLTLAIFLFVSCNKETPYMNDAIITGSDARTCICCGGLMISFNGETRPYTEDFRLIENGGDIGVTDKDRFPIYVKVDWKEDTTNVCNHILITRIARR
jgi:hypothetical protein